MTWNRKEVGNLLMVGAGMISAIQTAIFSKWIDARLVKNKDVAEVISWAGILSTFVLSAAWIISRHYMGRRLPKQERLDWRVGACIIFVFAFFEIGWAASLFW